MEYTRAIEQNLRGSKPRRRVNPRRKDISIFEDVLEDQELMVETKPELNGRTLLGKAARRMPGHAMRKKQEESAEDMYIQPAPDNAPRHRRVSTIAESVPELRFKMLQPPKDAPQPQLNGVLRKDPRRRTIFVPTDDTTMLTIHPGARNTERLDDTFQVPSPPQQPRTQTLGPVIRPQSQEPPVFPDPRRTRVSLTVAPQMDPGRSKQPRKSLAVAPKRGPLQQVFGKDNKPSAMDVVGQNGGKENQPPGHNAAVPKSKPGNTRGEDAVKPSDLGSRLSAPTAASQARRSVIQRKPAALPSTVVNASDARRVYRGFGDSSKPINQHQQRVSPYRGNVLIKAGALNGPAVHFLTSRDLDYQTQRPRSNESKSARLMKYPVFLEDIAQPELYEDGWLGQQEVALTEVVNQIFTGAGTSSGKNDSNSLRERLISVYHNDDVMKLYKRLQASLQFGALSRPQCLPLPPMPSHDIGLRKRFINLWLESYDEGALWAAAEVVIGRRIPRSQDALHNILDTSAAILDTNQDRRLLVGFLETFLVEVVDVETPFDGNKTDDRGRWRKMIIRSLMLVWCLDRAKTQGAVSGCLFKRSSSRKASQAMLSSLAALVIPSIGDIVRVVRHLDFDAHHEQDPLDEVEYHIHNLAVDLRDGVFLTRLVEVLLYSSRSLQTANFANEATMTIQLPDLTVIESALYNHEGLTCPKLLSRHLKIPSLARAQKLHNVQVALSALQAHGKSEIISSLEMSAEDIVDGHREKTLALLWNLVSNYGLDHLVDFKDLAADLRRNETSVDQAKLPADLSGLSHHQRDGLLKRWAALHCARKGIQIQNLTTSFASGDAYNAIVESFATYLDLPLQVNRSRAETLESRLRAFGCSVAFRQQLTCNTYTTTSRETTISNLAFLASRLLPLARRYHAAAVIQRAYRLRCSRITVSRRIMLMRLAHSCATVVQTQNRLVDAATVLQRAWRKVLDERIRRLHHNVTAFQEVAKGWLARRWLLQLRVGAKGGKAPSIRVMGGW